MVIGFGSDIRKSAVLGIALLLTLGALWFWIATRAEQITVDVLTDEVASDLIDIEQNLSKMPLALAVESLQRKSQLHPNRSIHFAVIHPRTRQLVAGNIPLWPVPPEDQRALADSNIFDFSGGRKMVGGYALLDRRYPVFVGRSFAKTAQISFELAWVLATIGILATGAFAFVRRLELARARRQFYEIDATLYQFEQGNRAARIAQLGDDSVGMIARRINGTIDRISTYIQGQELVAAQIAHELRSPLARMLADMQALPHHDNRRDLFTAQLERQLQLFDGVMAVAGVEQTHIKFRRIRLDEAVLEVISLFEDAAEDSNIKFLINIDVITIWGDRNLLVMMIANIVDNAIKYSASGGVIEFFLKEVDSVVYLKIDDCGPGMVNMPRNIGGFLERGQSTFQVDGLGLGLALCMRVAARHDGHINFTDRPGNLGLSVTLQIPASVRT